MQSGITKRHYRLTTRQGCLMVIVLVIVFGGILTWLARRDRQTIEGDVQARGVDLVPFGCHAVRSGHLTVPLRDRVPPPGFREERRALEIEDGSTESKSSQPRPVAVAAIAWRDEHENLTPMTCHVEHNALTVRSKRRGGNTRRRKDLWSGSLVATCQAAGLGEVKIRLAMENCD